MQEDWGAQTWYIVEPRPVDDNGRRIFVGSSVGGDDGEACVCIVESGANGRAVAPCSSQHERHSQELCNAKREKPKHFDNTLMLQGLGFKARISSAFKCFPIANFGPFYSFGK